MSRRFLLVPLAVAVVIVASIAQRAVACPFCAAVSQTFSEEIASMDAVVIARLVEAPPINQSSQSDEVPKAKFQIEQVVKGQGLVDTKRLIETIYFGDAPKGKSFLLMGVDPPKLMWSTPLAVTDRSRAYITQLASVPKEGADRLAFFQNHLEDAEEMLARDAYDEFAKSPYEVVQALKPKMKHDQLTTWIKDPNVPASRRRLYLTMLGVCGGEKDLPLLEEMLRSDDRKVKGGLDAMIGCYLTLKGADGMPLIENLFLKNEKAEYADTYAAIMALRFHGTETDIIPRERILQGLRHMLERPQLADLVIPDLARWEDWSQMERLVKLFKEADEKSSWVRVPVINYLRACPLPESKKFIDELEKVDPAAVKRANTFFPFGPAAAPTGGEKASSNDESPVAADTQNIAGEIPPAATSGDPIAAAKSIVPASRITPATAPANKPEPSTPNLLTVVAVPWLAGAVLMAVIWTILRGAG
jgi:hypothetical protein